MLNLAEKFADFKNQQVVIDNIGVDSRVLLVDSTNAYIRCFSATPSMNEDGDHVGGITGFLKSVGMSVRQFNPTRVVLVFDGKGGSARRRKDFDNYKNNRKTMQRLNRTYDFSSIEQEKDSMTWQLQVLVQLLECLPVTAMAIDHIEADDAIAKLAGLITDRGGKSVIVSTDKDFLQLVSETCTVYNPIKKKEYTVETVLEEYKIHPNNFLLYRIIDGDKSDNIDGVNGIALKTLLKHFPFLVDEKEHTVESIVEETTKLVETSKKPPAIAKKLHEAHEAGILDRNEKLMNLKQLNISARSAMEIVEQYDAGPSQLQKHRLTKLMGEYKLWDAFKSYDTWIMSTWTPLTRYSTTGE